MFFLRHSVYVMTIHISQTGGGKLATREVVLARTRFIYHCQATLALGKKHASLSVCPSFSIADDVRTITRLTPAVHFSTLVNLSRMSESCSCNNKPRLYFPFNLQRLSHAFRAVYAGRYHSVSDVNVRVYKIIDHHLSGNHCEAAVMNFRRDTTVTTRLVLRTILKSESKKLLNRSKFNIGRFLDYRFDYCNLV